MATLSPEVRQNLIEVLNAQSGIKRMPAADYKKAVAAATPYLNAVGGRFTGGIKPEVYQANKDDKDLVAAAQAHLSKAKEKKTRPQATTIHIPETLQQRALFHLDRDSFFLSFCAGDQTNQPPKTVPIPNPNGKTIRPENGEDLILNLIGCLPQNEQPQGFEGWEAAFKEARKLLEGTRTLPGVTLLQKEKVAPKLPEIHVYEVGFRDRNIPAKEGAKFLYGVNNWICFGEAPKALEKYRPPQPSSPAKVLEEAVQDHRNTDLTREILACVPEGEITESTPMWCAKYNPGFLKELLTTRPDIPRTQDYLSAIVSRIGSETLTAFKDCLEILGKPDPEKATSLLYAAAEEYKTYYGPTDERWKIAREVAVQRQALGKLLLELGANPHQAMEQGRAADRWEDGDDIADHDMDGEYEEFLSDMIDIAEGKPGKQFPAYILAKKKAEPDMPEMA